MWFCTSFWSSCEINRVGSCPKASAGVVHGSWQLLILVQVWSVYSAWYPWGMQYAVLALHVCVSTIHIPCVACTHIFLPLPYNSPCLSTTLPGIYVLYKKHMTQGVHYIIYRGHKCLPGALCSQPVSCAIYLSHEKNGTIIYSWPRYTELMLLWKIFVFKTQYEVIICGKA